MKFYFHEEAQTEFDKAVAYYEECRSGLGLEFSQEVYAAIARVVQFPEAWSPMTKNIRRCLVNRFPFGVIYRLHAPHRRFTIPGPNRLHFRLQNRDRVTFILHLPS